MPDSIDTSNEVLTELAPTQRILQILKSQELPKPHDREKDHLYYVYDKMKLYLYQSLYSDPFTIVESLPEELVENMLYIVLNGYMYTYAHGSIIELGHIRINEFDEVDPDQLDLLKKVGTVYFMNAESRYIDTSTRTLQLPYQNGSYQLTLSLAKDLMIDNETVISFNQETEQFEIMGAEFQPDKWLKDIYKYRGAWNETIVTSVEEGYNAIKSKVNIADISGNAIQILGKGLFVNAYDFASGSRYNDMVRSFVNYKNIIDRYVAECTEAIMTITASISQSTIKQKIIDVLEDYKPTIQEMFDKYAEFEDELNEMEYQVQNELPKRVAAAEQEIVDYVNSKDNAWSYFPEDAEPGEVLTQDQLLAQGMIISDYRSIVLTMREIEPEPEPEPTPDPEEGGEDESILGAGDEEGTEEETGGLDPVEPSEESGEESGEVTPSEDDPGESEDPVEPVEPDPEPEPEPTTSRVLNSHGYTEDEQTVSDMLIAAYNEIVKAENVVQPEPDPDPEESGEDEANEDES